MHNLSYPKGTIQSVERALKILSLFKENEELGITQIAKYLDLPKGTIHGLVKTLAGFGFLEQNIHNQKYKYGIEVFKMGLTSAARLDVRLVASKKAMKLCEQIDENVFLSVLLGGMCVIVDRYFPKRPFVMMMQIGSSVPAHCTAMGKVLLSELPLHMLREIEEKVGLEKFTPHTIVDMGKLREVLTETKLQGYNVSHQEALPGLSCVAAPIRDYTGQIIAALSISASTESLEKAGRLSEVIEAVMAASQETSLEMGYET